MLSLERGPEQHGASWPAPEQDKPQNFQSKAREQQSLNPVLILILSDLSLALQ